MADASRGPETRDVSPRALMIFGGGLIVFVAVAMAAVALLFDTDGRWPAPGASAAGNAESPALQLAPADDLRALQQRENGQLVQLGWIDRRNGIAKIPINDAMRIIAEQGLPDWPQKAAAKPGSDECALLRAQVPRSRQAERCREAAQPSAAEPAR